MWVCLIFPPDENQGTHFWQKTLYPSQGFGSGSTGYQPALLLTSDTNFDGLVKVVNPTFLHYNITIFPVQLIINLWGNSPKM